MVALRAPSPAGAARRRLTLVERLDAYERLMRLDKPIGTLLLLWPTLCALWFAAGGRPRFSCWFTSVRAWTMKWAGAVRRWLT